MQRNGQEQPIRFLLVARHYPPHITGAARRLSGLAASLRKRGHVVLVVAPDIDNDQGLAVWHPMPAPFPSDDDKPPSLFGQAKDFLRTWLLWPDPDIRWSRRAFNALEHVGEFDVIITSSPPESIHMVGRWFKAARPDVLWLADFRDSWFAYPLRKELRFPWRRMVERRIAKRIASGADLVFGVNDEITAEIAAMGARARARTLPHATPAFTGTPHRFDGKGPHLVHTGSFSLSDPNRKISNLLRAFETAQERHPELALHLAGRLTQQEQADVEASSSRQAIYLYGQILPAKAAAMQAGADALVLAGGAKATAPPGKFAEYSGMGKFVIAVENGPWTGLIYDHDRRGAALMIELAETGSLDMRAMPASVSHDEIAARVCDLIADLVARN